MNILIENYRGYEISFNPSDENFYVDLDDRNNSKKSFSSCKKYIDDYIKDNTEFTPFYVEKLGNAFTSGEKVLITGIRKDGKFNYEDKDGKKQSISTYSESDWFLVDEKNKELHEQLNELHKRDKEIGEEIRKLKEKIRKLKEKFIRKSLKDIKPKYMVSQ